MSRSNTRSRRANWKATAPALTACPRCREPKRSHQACPNGGPSNDRTVIDV
jgi:large subunit ribosomal protein L32